MTRIQKNCVNIKVNNELICDDSNILPTKNGALTGSIEETLLKMVGSKARGMKVPFIIQADFEIIQNIGSGFSIQKADKEISCCIKVSRITPCANINKKAKICIEDISGIPKRIDRTGIVTSKRAINFIGVGPKLSARLCKMYE